MKILSKIVLIYFIETGSGLFCNAKALIQNLLPDTFPKILFFWSWAVGKDAGAPFTSSLLDFN